MPRILAPWLGRCVVKRPTSNWLDPSDCWSRLLGPTKESITCRGYIGRLEDWNADLADWPQRGRTAVNGGSDWCGFVACGERLKNCRVWIQIRGI